MKQRRTTSARMESASTKDPAPKLWKHQQQTLSLHKHTPIVYDTSDPGTGKTRVALQAWWSRRKEGGLKALVIAPKSLLTSAWLNDARMYIPNAKVVLAPTEHKSDFGLHADLVITNTDAVKWIVREEPKILRTFDTLIVDESTTFKHASSSRSRAMRKLVRYFKYRNFLTGTPNSNTILDVWHQLFLLDDGVRLGTSFYGFRGSVCVPEQNGPMPQHIRWVDREGAEQAVAGLIADICIRHQFDECMDIPPNFTHRIEVELPNRLMQMYKRLENDSILTLENTEVVGVNAAVLANKLLQVASGAVYGVDGVVNLDSNRNELVMDLIEERRHSIVFFNWVHQRNSLTALAEQRGLSYAFIDGTVTGSERTTIVSEYQKGAYQVLFLHPKTGAHGLTLTKGTATIWISPIYEADFLKQGQHRIWRGGQTKKTETILIQAKNTIEEHVYDRLNQKTKRMTDLLEMIKCSRH